MTRECENGVMNGLDTNLVGDEGSQMPSSWGMSRRAAALDSRWKTRAMLDH